MYREQIIDMIRKSAQSALETGTSGLPNYQALQHVVHRFNTRPNTKNQMPRRMQLLVASSINFDIPDMSDDIKEALDQFTDVLLNMYDQLQVDFDEYADEMMLNLTRDGLCFSITN